MLPIGTKQEPIGEVYQTSDGRLVIRPRPGKLIPAKSFAEVARNPDGSLEISFPENWVSLEQAARMIGVSRNTVLRYENVIGPDGKPILDFHRPSPHRVLVSVASIQRFFIRLKENPEFWENTRHAIAKRPPRQDNGDGTLLFANFG